MINVLVVDDEPKALKALKYVIDWESYGFTIAGEAMNGRQALEQLKLHNYSVIITDIRMPGLSGIELISEIRAFSSLPIIVMSGHQDFQYAKNCMKYGVKDYLLKPVLKKDLEHILIEIQEELMHNDLIKNKLRRSITAIKEQALKKWLHGQLPDHEIEEQLSLVGIQSNPGDHYRVLILEIDSHFHMDARLTESEIQLNRFAVHNVIQEMLGKFGELCEDAEDRYAIILIGDSVTLGESEIRNRCELMVTAVQRYVKTSITIAAGQTVEHWGEVVTSHKTAVKLLERKFWNASDRIIMGEPHLFETGKMDNEEMQAVDQVIEAVKQKDDYKVQKLLQQQKHLFIHNKTPRTIVQATTLELLVNLVRVVHANGGDYEESFSREIHDYKFLAECKVIEDLFQVLELKCAIVIDFLREQKLSQPQKTVRLLKQITEELYGEDLSLRSIGTKIHVHPVYLGQIFKSIEGMSFNDYLLQLRMEKAKHLLLNTDKKVYEIVREIGYKEADWFYRKFKEYTGLSTKEFRDRSMTNHVE